MKIIKVGTRKSALALKQAGLVKTALEKQGITVEVVEIVSTGDKITDKPLWDIGGKGLFCKELDMALLNGTCDIAVHSAKDMETELAPNTEIFATLPREDVRDVFVGGYTIDTLPSGAVVGTCSLRRQSQILNIRNDITVKSIRGNVQTRLDKINAGEFDATFLAKAGLNRLGIDTNDWQVLEARDFIPSSGQGIIAIQGRSGDNETKDIVNTVNDNTAFLQLQCERAFLSGIDGSCKTPVGSYAEINGENITLHTFYGDEMGKNIHKQTYNVSSENECFEIGQKIRKNSNF